MLEAKENAEMSVLDALLKTCQTPCLIMNMFLSVQRYSISSYRF